jgi:hypothetical protein
MANEVRLSRIEDDIREHRARIDECHDRLDVHSESISSLEQWRKGNGAMGAEARLQCVEALTREEDRQRIVPRLSAVEADVLLLQSIADTSLRDRIHETVTNTLDARERKFMARLKAWTPLVVGLLTFVGIVIAAIFHVQL